MLKEKFRVFEDMIEYDRVMEVSLAGYRSGLLSH